MNLLFVIGVYPNFGGTERMTTILANEFVRRGHSVAIASFSQPHPELASELTDAELIPLSYPVNSKKNVEILREEIRKRNIGVIINQWCLPFYVTRFINKARNGTECKLISVLHGVPDRSKKLIQLEDAVANSSGIKRQIARLKKYCYKQVVKYSLRYVYRHSDRYVVLSDCFIDTFCNYSGQTENGKLTAIGNPISIVTDFNPEVISDKEKMILYVGRMDMENKRVNRIIDAWQAIADDYPDWNLTLVGDGPHRKNLEEFTAASSIPRVNFTGFLKEDPIDFYRRASILMLTSDLEGFGLVIIEGMSYGVVPVVYGSYESVYDIIENGRNGLITPSPYSKQSTVGALKELIDNSETRNSMASAAIESSKQFNLSAITDRWEQLFNE